MIQTQGPGGQQQMNVDISQTTEMKCEKCGNNTFKQTMMLRKLSAIVSPNGKETIIPVSSVKESKFSWNPAASLPTKAPVIKTSSPSRLLPPQATAIIDKITSSPKIDFFIIYLLIYVHMLKIGSFLAIFIL